MTTDTLELAGFLELTDYAPETLDRYADAAHVSFAERERFAEMIEAYGKRTEEGSGDALRTALGYLILGRYQESLRWFERAPASKWRHLYAARAALLTGQHSLAQQELQQARAQGADPLVVDMLKAAAHVAAGEVDAASELIQARQAEGQDRAEWHFAAGLLAEARLERAAAISAFEKCLTLDPDHTDAMFRAARLLDQVGLDQEALELYHMLALQPRAHVNALLNAAVIYEDVARYDEAAECLRRILRAFPTHTRARLFLKDVESCQEMVIEEGAAERADPQARLLDTPLSEFELTVRARNCLKKANIRTLGELVQLSEAELLAQKNFGETSLNEIKSLLARKGLRLGQPIQDLAVAFEQEPVPAPPAHVPPGQEAILSKSVSELELSVRARRCLQRLNVQTLGDLVQLSESDLLATRNFGTSSMNEVKQRLAQFGLELAPKKAG